MLTYAKLMLYIFHMVLREAVGYQTFFFFFNKILCIWERERERRDTGREKESRRTPYWVWSPRGAHSHDCELMTWAKAKSYTLNHLSTWATQTPQDIRLLISDRCCNSKTSGIILTYGLGIDVSLFHIS